MTTQLISELVGCSLSGVVLMLPTKCCPVQSVSLLHAYQLYHGELLTLSYREQACWLLASGVLYGVSLLGPMLSSY